MGRVCYVQELSTWHNLVPTRWIHRDNNSGEGLDNAQCNNTGHTEPDSKHPCAMLVNLQPLDIIICVDDAEGGGDCK